MAWLTGFSKRLKLTIQPDNVDNSLTDFPVMINLSSSAGKNDFDATSVFDELGDAHQKCIAVTKNDGTTQCPVEIEYWDATEEKAVLWTKIPTVYASVDTDAYFYYDATYSGIATISGGNAGYVGDINDTTYEMVIDIGSEGTYDTVHAYAPSVVKDGNTYRMWYAGYDGTNRRIIYATSVNGISWTGHQLVIDVGAEGTYDTVHAYFPLVIKDGNTYKMWYSGYDGTNARILYAISTDGITWTGHQLVIDIGSEGIYDAVHAYAPSVIKDGNTYKMWYAGYDGTNWRILYATSTNGISWSNYQMVVNNNNISYDSIDVYSPCVTKESDTSYKMWYAGYDGTNWRILYATSIDGIIWGNFELVLDKNCEGMYDTTHAFSPFLISNDLNRMWYAGYDGTNYRIMHSTYWKNPAQEVWDDDFKLVMHMNQDPSGGNRAIKDSTFNQNNGTSAGGMTTGDLVDGKVGKALDFDGSGDHVDITTITLGANTTFSWIGKSDITSPTQHIISGVSAQDRVAISAAACVLQFSANSFMINHGVTITDLHEYTIVRGSDITVLELYVDGLFVGSDTHAAGVSIDVYNLCGKDFSSAWGYYQGVMDEVHFSNIARSSTWIKAIHHSNWDDLIVFQQEEVETSWLSDWSNRTKLTIDHTKVDSTIVDFPVAVALNSSTGITGADVTNVFDKLYLSEGISWYDYQMVMNTGAEGVYDTLAAYLPSVIKDGNTYKMWYSGYDGTNWRILYATSADGITWSSHQMVINIGSEGTYDTVRAYFPSVIKDGSTYKMWYSGHNGTNIRTIYATSVNGITWTDYQLVIDIGDEGTYDTVHAYIPSVIKDGSTYKMWYSGHNGTNVRTIYAISTDGITWSSHQMVIDIGAEGTYDTERAYAPSVIKDGDIYKMWYSGNDGTNFRIIYVTSTNGITWSNHQMVINIGAEGTYDTERAYAPSVIKDGDTYKMWYTGYDGTNNRILYATSIDGDLNRKKIAITTNDGTTQCSVEIERWDAHNEQVNLWTKVPVVHNDEDTILYLYYDKTKGDNDTYVGDTGDTSAQNVWDNNFVGVWHMAQDPNGDVVDAIKNSTSSINHGTSSGTMTSADLIDGKIGKAIDFDGSDDYINCGSNSSLDDINKMTIETTFKAGGWGEGSSGRVISKSDVGNNDGWNVIINGYGGDNKFGLLVGWDTTLGIWYTPNSSITLNDWYYTVVKYDKSYGVSDKPILYLNGTSKTVTTDQAPVGTIESDAAESVLIAARKAATATDREFDGTIDEVRISNIYRSSEWIKATYYSNWNSLITYGVEQERPVFLFNGYVKVEGFPAARTVYLYKRSTGELVGDVISSPSTGYFEVGSHCNEYHFVVILPELTETYNLLSYDKIDPGV